TTYGGFFLPLFATGCNGAQCDPADFAQGLTPGDFLKGVGSDGTLNSYWSVNRKGIEQILNGAFTNNRIPNPPAVFSIGEKVGAGFAQANMKGANWRSNFGLRIVHTDQTSKGNVTGGGEISNAFGDFTPVTVTR